MKKLIIVFLVVLSLSWSPFLWGQETVEKIEIIGNERVTEETILYYLSSREGDYFNEELLRRDFKVLWSTGFFANLRIEQEEGERGKIIKVIVEENPIISDITFKTGKKLKENDIIDKLKENDEYILPYSYYSPFKIERIKARIEELLREKGLTQGKVDIAINSKGKNELEVVFNIDEGPKIRVGEVVFVGHPKLPQSVLRSALKENKKHGIIAWITGKDTFKPDKLEEDLQNIKKKLQEYGYMEATIGEPKIEDITKRSIFFKKQVMKKLIIPIEAGYRYRVGEIKIEGAKVFSSSGLRKMIKLKPGQLYNTKIREKSVEDIGELYRNYGYLYAQIMPVENLDPKRKLVNISFNIYEGDVVYLHRLEIRGNTYTKDKVIRRELLLREGDRFSLALFKDSLLRMKQLGLVELEKDPDIRPKPDDPTQMDVTLYVKELQRNNIQFTAGYSGYYGTFVALSYETVNFMGAGENLSLMFQYGKNLKNYSFGFTEPYIFDRPLSLGFSIYNRYMIYPGLFNQKTKGINLQFSARVKGYWRANLVYGFDYIDVSLPSEEDQYYFYDPYFYGSYYSGYPRYYPGGYMYGLGSYHMSSISGTVYRSTVDSPLTPSRGTLYLIGTKFAGSFLGGDISLLKPRFEFTHYQPLFRNQTLGFHLEYSFIKRIGDSQVPFWERFFLGGEMSIRGYDIYSIGPRGESGTNIGGEKSIVCNAEYIIKVGGPLYTILFFDIGNAYAPNQKVNIHNLYSSTGLEFRIFVPALRVPFRLIFAYNSPKLPYEDSNFNFRFAIGTTF